MAERLDLNEQLFCSGHAGTIAGYIPFRNGTNPPCVRVENVGTIPRMGKHDWRTRMIAFIKETRGVSMKGLSLKAGLNETAVRDILVRGFTPTLDTFLAIVKATGRDPFFFLYGDQPASLAIPVKGIVSAGEGWEQVADAHNETIEFAMEEHSSFSIEVRGDSMSPVYRHGDYLVCIQRTGRNVDNLVGLDCAVLTTDGNGFIKILKKGSRPGRYNLKSYNPVFDDIENVSLQWAAPIVWIKRAQK